MARLLYVLFYSSLEVARSGSFLQSRALRGTGPTQSLDRSLGWKSPQPMISIESSDFVRPFEAFADSNASEPPQEAAFEVHTMLHWAGKAGTAIGMGDPQVSEACVRPEVQAAFREAFTSAAQLMLQKTLHGMQHGLIDIAKSVTLLLEGTTCELIEHPTFEQLRQQALRLQVLASAGSVDDLDVTVKYEPLKALTVGGVDIHVEINALLIAWQLKKGPEAVGRALVAFLRDFNDDASADMVEETASADISEQGTDSVDKPPDVHESRTTKFWAQVLQTAMQRLGGHELMSEACLSAPTAHTYGDALEAAIKRMLEKTRQGMRSGIQDIATATIAFVDALESSCSSAVGAVHLRSAASRLRVFASAKTLVNFAKHVEYEPMKVLKVGGIDVHKEINRFLAAWLHNSGPTELAEGMVDFFQDFKEHEVEDKTATSDVKEPSLVAEAAVPEAEVLAILRDAISPDLPAGVPRESILPETCFSDEVTVAFNHGVETACETMLQKQHRSMQLGLMQLADVTDDIFISMSANSACVLNHDSEVLRHGARKLRILTSKTVVDFGTHIKYEAMKSLTVGDVDIHKELNSFISAWKLRSHREAGVPLGHLMQKLATIHGHDEL